MKVAIIDNKEHASKIAERISAEALNEHWSIDYFQGLEDFKAGGSSYEVIIAHCNKGGREIVKDVCSTSKAELFLMGNKDSFKESDIKNPRIKGLIDSFDLNKVSSCLEYASLKIKLNESLKKEYNTYDRIIMSKNGYKVSEEQGFLWFDINALLSERKEEEILNKIKESKQSALISFSYKGVSIEDLIVLLKIRDSMDGRYKVALLLSGPSLSLKDGLKACSFDDHIEVFTSINDAREALTHP